MKNQKLNLISLKKNSLNTLNTINKKRSSSKNESSFIRNLKEEGPYYLLPIIDKSVLSSAYQQPTSILTRYVNFHAKELIKNAEENIKKPAFLQKLEKKLLSKNIKSRQNKNKQKYKSKTISTDANIEGINTTDQDEKEKKINKFYLTAQDSKDFSFKTNINDKSNRILTESNYLWNKDLNSLNKDINRNRFSIGYGGIKKKFESSMSLDHELNKEKFKILNNTFHRLRTYQPKIEENWKTTNGLTINVGGMVPHSKLEGDIEYQKKLLNDQFKLLIDNIQYYKMSITSKDNYIEAFKCLSLKNKINYNKSLEEACGLLLLLPQLILVEFFKYIEKFENMNIPDKHKFKDKYIFDEVSCLYYNNNLLSEVCEYFQSCFEVYLILVKEVDDIALQPKKFLNVLSAFEKTRFDISYACNIAENAMLNYNKDINIINRLNRIDLIKNNINKKGFNNKMRGYNSFKKNSDRQRKLRIDACINNKEDKYNKNNDFMLFTKTNKLANKKKFNSIINSDLMTKILKHCKKDIKYEIMTQRINNELEESYSGDDEKLKKIHNIIKLNF